ncbi:LysR family transcriptional regulator [Streptomyces celluloflavus]|uniref:LysR family transcriptional regulator n=1 Tax=Streptomyces celluloflavus TaxID=58344 RepID=UPI0036BEA244
MAAEPCHLRYPLAVAEHAGFARATEAPLMSQPALSQQIRRPEHATQAQQLDRSGRSVRTTDTGASHALHTRRAVRDLAAGERAPGPTPTPAVRLGLPQRSAESPELDLPIGRGYPAFGCLWQPKAPPGYVTGHARPRRNRHVHRGPDLPHVRHGEPRRLGA